MTTGIEQVCNKNTRDRVNLIRSAEMDKTREDPEACTHYDKPISSYPEFLPRKNYIQIFNNWTVLSSVSSNNACS